MKKLLVLSFVLTMISCENPNQNKSVEQNVSTEKQGIISTAKENLAPKKSFDNAIEFARYCATQIKEGKINSLKSYTDKGILFSPYAYIDYSSARVVGLDELSNPKDQLHYWGVYEGRGDSILLSTTDYLNKFVFNFDIDKDNIEVKAYNDNPKSRGSEMQNIQKLYPNAISVEFYEPPSKEGYMDWNALIFVIHKNEGHYSLEAIVHNQWAP